MSSFIDQRTREIFQNASTDVLSTTPPSAAHQESDSQRARNLKSTLAGLHTPPNDQQLAESLNLLNEALGKSLADPPDPYAVGISERVIAGLYARTMEEMLQQALEADREARFWWDVERSKYNTTWFLMQTIPLRLQRLATTFVDSLRRRNIPVTLSTLRLNSIRRLFPTTSHPSELLIAAFPHLTTRNRFFPSSPFTLAHDECRIKRKQLEKLRDDRALRVGLLASASHDLEQTMSTTHSTSQLSHHIALLQMVLTLGHPRISVEPPDIYTNFSDELSGSREGHRQEMSGLRRPSRWVQTWPRFLLIPPVTYFFFKYAYGSRESITQHAKDAWETTRIFWESWVLEPINGILATVRTRGDAGVRVISKDALRADMDSLERMAVALGKEKLGYGQQQLDVLREQVERGDLTAVLRVYEEDIKSPIRSAMTGTLVRSLLIQVQKMKVDVDFALSGIDKLLRSQELTFGFVGVAPALAIVYLTFNWAWESWKGGRGRGKFGGKTERSKVWNAVRRIEKLLISPPRLDPSSQLQPLLQSYNALGIRAGTKLALSHKENDGTGTSDLPQSFVDGYEDEGGEGASPPLSPLANGLLLLASTQLRAFAEAQLRRSEFRDDFLEDVKDLEDGRLSRKEKRMVLDRMWRSWGRVLGWDNLAGL